MYVVLIKPRGKRFLTVIPIIANGFFYEKIFKLFGAVSGLPLSGITLAVIVLRIVYLTILFNASTSPSAYHLIWFPWFEWTLSFKIRM